MDPVFFKSKYEWAKGDLLGSCVTLDEYLIHATDQEVFSLPDDFFNLTSSSFNVFFNRLLSNDCLRAAFCDIFPPLWENNPNNDLLTSLIIRDFSKPSMTKKFGMEEFGFSDPEEDFQKVLSAFRNTAHRGFLTNSNQPTAHSCRVHLDFAYLKTQLLDPNWLKYKDELWAFEKELDSIHVTWDQISKEDNNLIISSSLYELFGRYYVVKADLEVIATGCLQRDVEWKNALVKSIEVAMEETSKQELDELVKTSCQFVQMDMSGEQWLKNFLNYTVNFDQKLFYKLYQNGSAHNTP